jgi:predicted Zn-dependent protease
MTKKIKLSPEINKLLDEAYSLCREKKYDEGISLLKQICQQAPKVPFSYGQLGKIAWEQGKLPEANLYFRETVALIPDSSLASLCVFHTFWEMNEYEFALKEIKRYQKAGGKCEDYDKIIKSLIEKNIIDEDLNLLRNPESKFDT